MRKICFMKACVSLEYISVISIKENQWKTSWLEAITLGAQGNYSAAAKSLSQIYRDISLPIVARSLAYSTYASHLRQQGWHSQAFIYDSHALYLAAYTPARLSESPQETVWSDTRFNLCSEMYAELSNIAIADALTGLAADNLGMERFSVAEKYLRRTELYVITDQWQKEASRNYIFSQHRLMLRWLWVQTEFFLYTGNIAQKDWAQRTLDHLSHRVDLPPRYKLKTWLIAHAAQINITDFTMDGVRNELEKYNLLPLLWAFYLMHDRQEDAAKIRGQFRCENWLMHK